MDRTAPSSVLRDASVCSLSCWWCGNGPPSILASSATACAAEEGNRLAIETGQLIWAAISEIGHAVLVTCKATNARRRNLGRADEQSAPQRLSILLAQAEFARGVIATTAGRHSDAVDHFSRMFVPDGPAFHEPLPMPRRCS